MKNDQIHDFYDDVLNDKIKKKEFDEKISTIQTKEELIDFINEWFLPLAKEKGYDFTEDDIIDYMKNNVENSKENCCESTARGPISNAFLFSMPLMLIFSLFIAEGVRSTNKDSLSETTIIQNTSNSDADSKETSEIQPQIKNLKAASVKEKKDENGRTLYNNIMKKAAEANENFNNSKIIDIAMLGAHDACTANIKAKFGRKLEISDFAPDGFKSANYFNWSRRILGNYAKAQSEDVYRLLERGARMLDVRVTTKGQEFKTYHSVISGDLKDSLKGTIEFLLDNPGEFVVFHIGNYQSKDMPDTINLAKYIATVKVDRDGKSYSLYDLIRYDVNKKLEDLTYGDVTNDGKEGGIYISMDDKVPDINSDETYSNGVPYKKLLNKNSVKGQWLNSRDTNKIMDDMTQACENIKDSKTFRVCQYQTSPDTREILFNGLFKNGSLLNNAEIHNNLVINDPRFDENMKKCPIAWFDNISTAVGGFNEKVNKKILDYNKNLNSANKVSTTNTINYKKVKKATDMTDNMRFIMSKSKFYYGSYAKGKDGSVKDGQNNEWILEKSGDKWKIKLPNGQYLKRTGSSLIPKLGYTGKKNSATSFTVKVDKNGVTFTDGNKYSLVEKGSSLNFIRGKKATSFIIYKR